MGIYYWPLKNFVYRLTQKIFWNKVVLVGIEFEQRSVFLCLFFFFFWPHHAACGILVP